MKLARIHHVAYRCKDAKETVEWYVKHLNMDFVLAIAEDQVPSTKAPDPYMHVFLDAGQGNVLAFFELPNSPEMGRDLNTPTWVQHLAFKVDSLEELLAFKEHLVAHGIDVIGVTTPSSNPFTSLTPMAIAWKWPATPAHPRCTNNSTRSNGPCWKSGAEPNAPPNTRPGCMPPTDAVEDP
jgi:catechol 2,3-dioxygenase-like lactoylglutathione lyase family enzyme